MGKAVAASSKPDYNPESSQHWSRMSHPKCDSSDLTGDTAESVSSIDDDATLSSSSSLGDSNNNLPSLNFQRRSSRVFERRRSARKLSGKSTHNNNNARICEMRASVSRQRRSLIDMMGNTKLQVGVEPYVYDDIQGESVPSYDLIAEQRRQIRVLADKCTKLEEATTPVETSPQEKALLAKDEQISQLQAKLGQLEVDRAKRELQLRNKIANDAREYEEMIKTWQKEAACWKVRFKELWSKSLQQGVQPPREALETSQPPSGDSTNMLIDATKLKKTELVRAKSTTSIPYATGEDQANFLKDAMNKNKRSSFKLGIGRHKSVEKA